MDQILRQRFLQQLSRWADEHLEAKRLPFRRLEISPVLLTEGGRLAPDMVLWINRHSYFAGSMVLLPDKIDNQVLNRSVAMAKALGLGHFATWSTQKIQIWQINRNQVDELKCLTLPQAEKALPHDYQKIFYELLEQLKVVTVSTALPSSQFIAHYYANLCLNHLFEMVPGLTVSARRAAGQSRADDWLNQAPLAKAWLCIWRILFLIFKQNFPLCLQPEKLGQALHYALEDIISDEERLSCIKTLDDESPLNAEDAVHLHHLASRILQTSWPKDVEQIIELVDLLLNEVSLQYELFPPQYPWAISDTKLWVNCNPSNHGNNWSLVAPRPMIAGWSFKMVLLNNPMSHLYAEDLFSLTNTNNIISSVAILNHTQSLERKKREALLVLLRRAWPNRRFDLSKKAPAWILDALYLTGIVSHTLVITFPKNWHKAEGVDIVWNILIKYYHLTEILVEETGRQTVRLVRSKSKTRHIKVYRPDLNFEAPSSLVFHQPGTLQIWCKAQKDVIEQLLQRKFFTPVMGTVNWSSDLQQGTFLFLMTRLGEYLWNLCSDSEPLPDFEAIPNVVEKRGMLLPEESILKTMGVIEPVDLTFLPDQGRIEKSFSRIMGSIPIIPELSPDSSVRASKRHSRKKNIYGDIVNTVFRDGLPQFPEHYLMKIYRQEMIHFDVAGPLEIKEEFFDRIVLCHLETQQQFEVQSKIVAEALLLASRSGKLQIDLPKDEDLLAKLLSDYINDLTRLWDHLVRECRRTEPHRRRALTLARKIWQQQGLPQYNFLKETP